MTPDNTSLPKERDEILTQQIEEVLKEYSRPSSELFLSAFTAGLEIGFSVLLMGVLYTMFHNSVSENMIHLILAASYPVGFIFIVIGRSVLFTEHTTLAILPVLNQQTSILAMFRHWTVVYAGNILGGFIFAVCLVFLGRKMSIISPETFEHLADKMVSYSPGVIVLSGIVAGWLMGLLSWLLTAARETISRIFMIMMVTGLIGIAGLHHSIVGSIEVLAGMFSSDAITLMDYSRFQICTTIGNTIGGVVFVGILKFSHVNVKLKRQDY